MKAWWAARLQERSTWAALLTVFGALFGRQMAPDQAEAITLLGMLAASAIGVATKEKPPT